MEYMNNHIPTIMIVDDVAINVKLLNKMVEKMGYKTIAATSVEQAIDLMKDEIPTLILSDIVMPGINGYQFCEMLKDNPMTRDIPIIFVSAVDEMSDKEKAFRLGAVDFIQKPYEYGEVAMRLDTHLKIFYMQQELTENNKRLNMVVKEQSRKLESEQKRLLRAFSRFAEGHRFFGMGTHMDYVSYNSRLLAQALNFTEKYENKISSNFVEAIEIASSIHDIGKVTIPREILGKTEPLTLEDRKIIEQHTVNGSELLKEIYGESQDNEFTRMAIDVVRWHHENYDGSGYPDKLSGEEIPLSARIVAIIDTFDAIHRERCYMHSHTHEKSLEIMREETGKKFDPYIMDTFFRIEKQLKVCSDSENDKERTYS